MQISKVIKAYNMTQSDVAEKMSIEVASLRNMISKGNFNLTTLRRLADAIGCPISEFFADEEPAHPDSKGVSAEVTCPHCGKMHEVMIIGVSVK